MDAVASKDEEKISNIFSLLDSELKKVRDNASIRTERNRNMWDDPEEHFRLVAKEEVIDLEREYEHRVELFQLARRIQYKPQIIYQFAKMIQNRADIRDRKSIRTERNKNMWDDPEEHSRLVAEEERLDRRREHDDFFDLYGIAETTNIEEVINLILGDDTPTQAKKK